MKLILILFVLTTFAFKDSLLAQQIAKADTAIISRIKNEGFRQSQVMNTLFMLTDVYGPRLTNSPNYTRAAQYAKSTLEGWGIQNVHFDKWDETFGRGWELRRFSLNQITPGYLPLHAYPKAWTPGVRGVVKAEAVYLDVRSEEGISKFIGKLKNKIVLFSLPVTAKPGFLPNAVRLTDSALLVLANSPAAESFTAKRFQAASEPQRLAYLKWELCLKEGALAVLESTPRFRDGIISLGAATVPYPADFPQSKRLKPYSENPPRILPQIVVGAEHYNHLVRLLENKTPVNLELTLETAFTEAAPGFNVIGEIPGTELKNEVVMIGAHLDSWHSATGTTDNAVGAAVMMEAMRIISSLPAKPRRTIRIALWGGEEQGLLGSVNYVSRILGERFDSSFPYDSVRLTPAGEKFSVYFNSDLGTGKFRGIYLQGNESAGKLFREWLKPFEKMGTSTLSLKNITGTDHLSFNAIGLPAFQFIQDPIEYGTTTYHSNADLYEKAVEADLKHNAVVTATLAWMAANHPELFPRK